MCFREDAILDFERAMLSSGECSYLLPMMFISGGSKHVVYYDCKGFVPLSRYRVDKTEDALFILEKVLIILTNAIGYLITPAKIFLSTDTVFYNFCITRFCELYKNALILRYLLLNPKASTPKVCIYTLNKYHSMIL